MTIVVLLILAGITISYVMGDNSVFKKASDAKLKADIAQWQERLELAKSPVFIEGLGTFDPDKYFDYIQQQGIINNKDTDVVDNEDGTYDVTTKPGYVFLVTLVPTPEKPTDAEIEYIGQAGKIVPIIKRLDVNATSTSITGKATVSRLGNGTIKYYYKLKTESDDEYKEIINVNDETGATQSTGIVAGTEYVIKVVAKNDVGEVEKIAEITATKVFVESISINTETENAVEGKTEVIDITTIKTINLTAVVKPSNATNKNITWTSSTPSVATVNQTGKVTIIKTGTTTITVASTDGSDKTASYTLNVTKTITKDTMTSDEASWEAINRVAKAIANDSNVNSSSDTATGTTELGENYTINVGDIFKVQWNGAEYRVRVLGFKHDDLVNTSVYESGITATKASISFEFYDCMGTHTMNGTNSTNATNANGWAATEMRNYLEGSSGRGQLSNNSYLKQVKKKYIKVYDDAGSVTTSNDYLWLLSCSEIFKDGYKSGYYGTAIAKEGEQYLYYKNNAIEAYSEASPNRVKYYQGRSEHVWLRSPEFRDDAAFCRVLTSGAHGNGNWSYIDHAFAPAFCI